MREKTISLAIVVLGVILVAAPIVYLYYGHTVMSETVANSTWTLNGDSGVSYVFAAPSGSILTLATGGANDNMTYIIIVDSPRGTLLQYKVTGEGGWRLALAGGGSYEVKIINPFNTTVNGYVLASIEYKVPVAASPSASTYLLIAVLGGILVGWGAGRS